MSNDRWLECRAHGPKGDIEYTVGGSDVATIFGISPWTTPLELWMIKKGRMKPAVKANALQLEMGHLLEPIAAHFYAVKSGNRVYDDTYMYQHADHPYALADFDRRFERASDGEPGILECKSTTYRHASDWDDGGFPLYYEMQLRFYLSVADVNIGAFSAVWGNNPDNDIATPEITRDMAKEDMIFEKLDQWIWSLKHDKPPTMSGIPSKLALESLARIYQASIATPEITRDMAKEDMIFEKLDQWIWSLKHDKPPTMSGIPSKLALESLARIYQASDPTLPTVELPRKCEPSLRKILSLQKDIDACQAEIKRYEEQMKAHTVRIAELMKEHEHGVLETTTDKLLIDFVTKSSKRVSSTELKKKYPLIYDEVVSTSNSRKLRVSAEAK